MSEFDVTFELFTLLLGLAIAEVLAGYVRAFKLKARIRAGREDDVRGVRIGWLTPLSAAVVVCHQATFFFFMYQMQGSVPLHFLSLLAVMGLIGWYYLISAALWPDDPEAWPDFDEHCLAQRRFIWFGVIAIALLAEAARAYYAPPEPVPDAPAWMIELWDWTDTVGSVALLAMPFLRSVRWAGAVLAVLVAHLAVLAALSPWVPI